MDGKENDEIEQSAFGYYHLQELPKEDIKPWLGRHNTRLPVLQNTGQWPVQSLI
jgi:hypothetical protein